MKASGLPSGLNTIPPSGSSDLPLSWNTLRPPTSVGSPCSAPLLPQPHHKLPSRSTLKPSIAPGAAASMALVRLPSTVGVDVIAPYAAVGRAPCFDDVELLFVRRERQAI